MRQEELITLWQQGREAWNKWAEIQLQKSSTVNEGVVLDFSGRVFEEFADFSGFHFPFPVTFEEAIFMKGVKFDEAVFDQGITFVRADFRALVTFRLTSFAEVPDFRFTGFIHAPAFGNTRFPKIQIFNSAFSKNAENVDKYKALKALARRAGYQKHVGDFTAREIVARRHVIDQWWQPRFWLGLLYQFSSDFGRSLARPFLIWLISIPVFSILYLMYYQEQPQKIMPDDPTNIEGWWNIIKGWFSFGTDISVTGLECTLDEGSLLVKSFYLSFKNALLNIGGSDTSKLNQIYACLYGENTRFSSQNLVPVIPDNVAFIEIAQMSLSAILMVLFILGFVYQFHKK